MQQAANFEPRAGLYGGRAKQAQGVALELFTAGQSFGGLRLHGIRARGGRAGASRKNLFSGRLRDFRAENFIVHEMMLDGTGL